MKTRPLFSIVAFLIFCSQILAAEELPNIVFAFADDWGRHASAYAKLKPGGISDIISTPNFDRVAKEGVLFTNAFVTAPSCTPCRSSILSGQYFFRTGRGAILQGAIWDDTIPSYPHLLRDTAYCIGHTYKVWSPGTPVNAPFGGKQLGFNKAGTSFSGFSQAVTRESPKTGMVKAKEKRYEEVRRNFRQFLESRKSDQPFHYWFGPTNVHRKWIKGSGKSLWGMNPDDLRGKLPAFLPDVPEVRQDVCDYLGEAKAFDEGVGVLLAELERIGELENTLFVISGDHGFAGFPNGKCSLYDTGVGVSLAMRWPGKIPPNRVVEDFVNLMDLAPTFLEAAGETPPEVMTGRSLVPVVTSEKSGLVDPSRDYVVVGRERHVARARKDNLPYPQRAIRTRDFLYIRNFKPDRWPMGTGPGHGEPEREYAKTSVLENNTFACYGDMDASPTKAWIIEHRADPGMEKYFEYAFGRRPAEELYDCRKDPDQIQNVIDDPAYAKVRGELSERLMTILKANGDPRVTGDGMTFERPPYTSLPAAKPKKKREKAAKPKKAA
ncbi:MAG: sulfatase [Planctomycetota bacterium]